MPKYRSWKDLLSRDERSVLERLYISHAIATDQLRRAPDVLAQITRAFQAITGRTDLNASDLLGYMLNRRKQSDWVCLGDRAVRLDPWGETLTEAHFAALMMIYLSLDETSDSYLLQAPLMRQVEVRFHKMTKCHIDGSILVAAMIAKRKRGVWPTIRRGQAAGFEDIRDI